MYIWELRRTGEAVDVINKQHVPTLMETFHGAFTILQSLEERRPV